MVLYLDYSSNFVSNLLTFGRYYISKNKIHLKYINFKQNNLAPR